MKVYALSKITKLSRNSNLDRSLLKKTTNLINLAGNSIHERDIVMIIPGGLNPWERLYHASTGNFTQSVKNRWYEKSTGNFHDGDYEIKIGDHLCGDPDYQLRPVDTETDKLDVVGDLGESDDNGHHGIVGKILDLFTGD